MPELSCGEPRAILASTKDDALIRFAAMMVDFRHMELFLRLELDMSTGVLMKLMELWNMLEWFRNL